MESSLKELAESSTDPVTTVVDTSAYFPMIFGFDHPGHEND